MLRLWKHKNGKLYVKGTAEKGAKPVFESTGYTFEQIEEAQDYLEKKREQLRTERLYGKKVTVSFAEAMTAYVENGGSPRFLDKLLEHFKETPLHKIGQKEIDNAAKTLLPTAQPATRLRQIYAPMSAILHRAAHDHGYAPIKLKRPKDSKGVERWLKPDEAERLIEACSPSLRPLVIFRLYTGARPGECLWITWGDIDLAMKQATFRDTKNGETRSVPLNSRVIATLEALPHRKGEVFLSPAGKPYARFNEDDDADTSAGARVKTAFAGARKRAGIDPKFRFYDLRHTWATWHYQKHHDLTALQSLGGWKTKSMVFRYAHTNVENHAASMEDLPGVNSLKAEKEVA